MLEQYGQLFLTKARDNVLKVNDDIDLWYILIGKCIHSSGKHYYVLEFFKGISTFLLGFSP